MCHQRNRKNNNYITISLISRTFFFPGGAFFLGDFFLGYFFMGGKFPGDFFRGVIFQGGFFRGDFFLGAFFLEPKQQPKYKTVILMTNLFLNLTMN